MNSWIKTEFANHVELLKTLAAIPAPSHHEEKRVEFITGLLRGWGAEGVYTDEAKNVCVPFGIDEGTSDITVYSAHTDVVFPDTEPLPVREEDGRLFAPGIGDDTANVTAILTLIRYILETGRKPKSPVLFVLNSCEEGLGNLKGVRQIMKDNAGRIKELVSFDCTFEDGMIVKAVGSERWRVNAKTQGGHSFGDFGSPNAIHRMSELVTALYSQQLPDISGVKTTYNVGMINGGTSVNTIAPSCEILYEYRSDDRIALAFMRERFQELMWDAQGRGAEFSAELIGERPCGGRVDRDAYDALLARCETAITSVRSGNVKRGMGSTDANIPLSLGVPAVTFGLYSGKGEHTRDEWLEIDSLRDGLKIAFELVLKAHFE
ncbi:MAG: M20/M25/M40 family metallo-hydrolase [Clostridiales bacterium]|nr:M20/M25/M40 family metallo-hydrolase [Clostridiales bacterium]